jgi:hypothetical protein
VSISIVVKQDLLLGCPGELGRGFPFKAGEIVRIGWVPTRNGDGREADALSFWTGADIDFGLIFNPKDVAEVRITADESCLEFIQRMWPGGPITILPARTT